MDTASTPIELDLGDFRLRTLRSSDAPSIALHLNNRNVSRNLSDGVPLPYCLEDAHRFIKRFTTGEQRALVLCIDVDGEAVGAVGAHGLDDVYRKTAKVGCWLAEPLWGRGIATRALSTLSEQAFARLELVRLEAAVFSWNKASARVLEKAGYVLEGVLRDSVFKDGQLADSLLYARLRR